MFYPSLSEETLIEYISVKTKIELPSFFLHLRFLALNFFLDFDLLCKLYRYFLQNLWRLKKQTEWILFTIML